MYYFYALISAPDIPTANWITMLTSNCDMNVISMKEGRKKLPQYNGSIQIIKTIRYYYYNHIKGYTIIFISKNKTKNHSMPLHPTYTLKGSARSNLESITILESTTTAVNLLEGPKYISDTKVIHNIKKGLHSSSLY